MTVIYLVVWSIYWFMAGVTTGILNENLGPIKKLTAIFFWPFLFGCMLWIYVREKSPNEAEMIKDASRILLKGQISSMEEKRPS